MAIRRSRLSRVSIIIYLFLGLAILFFSLYLNYSITIKSKAASSCNAGVYDVSYNPNNQICTVTASDNKSIGCFYRSSPSETPVSCDFASRKLENPVIINGTNYIDFDCSKIASKMNSGGQVGALRYDSCSVLVSDKPLTYYYQWYQAVWKSVSTVVNPSERIKGIVNQIESVCQDNESNRSGVVTASNYKCAQKIVATLGTDALREIKNSPTEFHWLQCSNFVNALISESSHWNVQDYQDDVAYKFATASFLPGYKYHDITEARTNRYQIKPGDLVIWKSKGVVNGATDPGHIAIVVETRKNQDSTVKNFDIAEANSTVQGGYHGYVRIRTITYDYSDYLAGWQEKL